MATTLRFKTYQLLETNQGFASRLFNVLLMLLIFANVSAVVVESVRTIYQQWQREFYWFELVSVAIFTVEYLLRIWVAPDHPQFNQSRFPRLAFMRSGMALVDILAIAPFYLSMLVGIDTRVLRGLRLLRIFKLTRYSASMELMVTVVKKELPSIGSAMFVMAILIILAASGMYVVERDAQPEAFGSIPHALWWATVTLTTVGYGDVVPVTLLGRMFGVLLMLTGVGMAALPAGILAAGYSRELTLRREKFEATLKGVLEDGHLSQQESVTLAQLKADLGVSDEEEQELLHKIRSHLKSCPHCGAKFSLKDLV